ncbi:hypothetical protein CEXT_794651 [Caerostris extrusa]|uniref:Uncharacterized protein n=1 Tax=Caerostris extrusa TaxID=172846 RepID=A0AAV4TLB2_CAEEX|nr:hypothetical protein CEXT_794651 [Caerostris extrusa]
MVTVRETNGLFNRGMIQDGFSLPALMNITPGSHGVTLDGIRTVALGEARLIRREGRCGMSSHKGVDLSFIRLGVSLLMIDSFVGRERPENFAEL